VDRARRAEPEKTDEVLAVYRYYAKLHHELVPFFYSLAEQAYAGGPGIVRPIGEEADWPSDYRFELGSAFLVAPILDGTGVRDVELPPGARYFDWWAPDTDALDGGQTLTAYDATADEKIPLFVRAGAIVPLEVGDDVTGLGTAASAGKLTVLVYPDTEPSTFDLRDTDDTPTLLEAVSAGSGASVTLSRALRPTLLRVRADIVPGSVEVDGVPAAELADRAAFDAAETGWFFEAATRSAWVHVPEKAGAITVTLE
jgi:alpha-glucosidase (family GH31 glycosyl hydrolase)